MRTSGELLTRSESDVDFLISQAVIVKEDGLTRVSIDWDEEGKPGPGHLEGYSRDGMHFSGHFGYSAKDEQCEYQLTLFSNKNDRILFGRYCDHGDEGIWLFRLRGNQPGFPDGEGNCFVFRGLKEGKGGADKQSKRKTLLPKTDVPIKPPIIVREDEIKDGGVSEFKKKRLAKSKPRRVEPPPKSAKLEHLLKLTVEEYRRRGRAKKVLAELESAKQVVIVKVMYDAEAEEVRAAAREVHARRWG